MKLQPQAPDIEKVVLGTLITFPEMITQAIELLPVEAFYKPKHQEIYTIITRQYGNNTPVDILTICDEYNDKDYIRELSDPVVSPAHVDTHIHILLEKYIQREIIRISADVINEIYQNNDPLELLEQLTLKLDKLSYTIRSGQEPVHISVLTENASLEAKNREKQAKEGKCPGIRSRLTKLDRLTGGWQNSELIILAGRPGMGKTALMLKFAKEAAMEGSAAAIFSLEMSGVKLADRLILSESDIDPDKYKSGFMSKEDWEDFYMSKAKLSKLPIYIDDSAIVSMRYIKSQVSRLKRKGKCDIVFIDYLGLVDMVSDRNNRNRENEVAEASRQAKMLAKNFNIPVILVCQLHREVERRADRKPILSDLRESGAIEQDADVVMFAYRAAYYGISTEVDGEVVENLGHIIIAKQRNGAIGEIRFKYNDSLTKIYDYEPKIETRTPF